MLIFKITKGKENLIGSVFTKYGFKIKPVSEKGFLACSERPLPELIKKFEGYIQEIIEVNEEEGERFLKNEKKDNLSNLREGSAIEVISGIYEGFGGIARRVNDGRVLVDLNLFGKAVSVEVSASDVRILPSDPWS